MTTPTPREALAEALWLEPGLMRKPWAEWDRIAPDETGAVRMRTDHLIRLLDRFGCAIVRTGEPATVALPDPAAPIWAYGGRVLRHGDDGFVFAKAEDGRETVLMRFGIADAYADGGRIMTGDRAILKEPGVLTRQACALEIHRVHALGAAT